MLKNTERFSNRVENYVKYRPGYPKEFIDYIYSNGLFSKESIIADIGSGTGILTSLLLERGSRVVGVEPNQEMRKAAENLLGDYPKFVSVDGTAEAAALSDDSVDHIICAQAFHWFDLDQCRKEFQRIIKPNGKVILVWNKRVIRENGFLAEYEAMVRTYGTDYKEVNHYLITEERIKSFFKDGEYTRIAFNNEQLYNFEGLKGRLLSSSYAPLAGERHVSMIDELQRIFDKYNASGKVKFEYETEAYIGEV